MSNTKSQVLSGLKVLTSISIDEENNAGTNATSETPLSGLFINPSVVGGRPADISGFLVTSENEYGKLEFSNPDGFLSLDELSDVTITAAATNNLLSYNGTVWVNTDDVSVDSVTITKGTVTQITSLVTPVTVNASAGVITTFSATTAGLTVESFTVNNTSVLATSSVNVTQTRYGGTLVTNGIPQITVDSVAAGSFVINVTNLHTANALAGVLNISFVVV